MVSISLSFVIQLFDDFSGKAIEEDAVAFTYENKNLPARKKSGGFYVFFDKLPKRARILVAGIGYYEKVVEIDVEELEAGNPVLPVRLLPIANRLHSYPYDVLEGKLTAGKKMTFPTQVAALKSTDSGLLLKEIREEDKLQIMTVQGFTREKLVGLLWQIGGEKDGAIVEILEKRSISEYVVAFVNQKTINIKAGTPVRRVYRSMTDAEGYYAIPVDVGEEKLIQTVYPITE